MALSTRTFPGEAASSKFGGIVACTAIVGDQDGEQFSLLGARTGASLCGYMLSDRSTILAPECLVNHPNVLLA
jgi:hypothetical protein